MDSDEINNKKWINDEIKNKYNNSPYRIPLRNKYKVIIEYSLVDEEDFQNVMKYKWHLSCGYAIGYVDKKHIRLHHFVYKKPSKNNVIDHIFQDKLDNRKCMLREIDEITNASNKKKSKRQNVSSQYKGVHWDDNAKKFRARYKKCLGSFDNEFDAAIQYDIYTFQMFGKYVGNNNLISYEDALDIDISDIFKTKKHNFLPENIYIRANKFYAKKNYNNVTYSLGSYSDIKESLLDLIVINYKINYVKLMEEFNYLLNPILRDNNGVAIIKSDKNKNILVDDEHWFSFNKYKWSECSTGHLYSSVGIGSMHSIVIENNICDDNIIDHINKNKYDNRKINLRIATRGLNAHNRTKSSNTSSSYYGVTKRSDNKWITKISQNNVGHYVGIFSTEIEAANAYNKKAIELYGNNANLNDIPNINII